LLLVHRDSVPEVMAAILSGACGDLNHAYPNAPFGPSERQAPAGGSSAAFCGG